MPPRLQLLSVVQNLPRTRAELMEVTFQAFFEPWNFMGLMTIFTLWSFFFEDIAPGHWIRAAKMKILPQPEIELQSSSQHFFR
jgi:hypothetical protein